MFGQKLTGFLLNIWNVENVRCLFSLKFLNAKGSGKIYKQSDFGGFYPNHFGVFTKK